MYLIMLTYDAPQDTILRLRAAHYEHIDRCFAEGVFLFGARRVPSTGGVILAHDTSRDDLVKILDDDPFVRAGAARYEIWELTPMRAVAEVARALGLDPEALRPGT